jgi:hypothetical protein
MLLETGEAERERERERERESRISASDDKVFTI